MAKVLGGESLRAFGYQQMRDEAEQRRQEDMLRKTQGSLGENLMALSGDVEAGDADDRNTLRYLGLAASADTGPIGQIASAIGKIKGMGAIEKKREAERGRKDIMSKMLLGGATDLSLDEIGELEQFGDNPEFIQKIIDYKRSEARRKKLEAREDEKFEWEKQDQEYSFKSKVPAGLLKEYGINELAFENWSLEQKKKLGARAWNLLPPEALVKRYNESKINLETQQNTSLSKELTRQDRFYSQEGQDELDSALDYYEQVSGARLDPSIRRHLKSTPQAFNSHFNNTLWPQMQQSRDLEKVWKVYENELRAAGVESLERFRILDKVPGTVIQRMVAQNAANRRAGEAFRIREQIMHQQSLAQPLFDQAFSELKKRELAPAKAWAEANKDGLAETLYDDDGELKPVPDEKIVDVYMATWEDDRLFAWREFALSQPAILQNKAEIEALSLSYRDMVGNNPILAQGIMRFNSEDAIMSQISRIPNGTPIDLQGRVMRVMNGQLEEVSDDEQNRIRAVYAGSNTLYFTEQVKEANEALDAVDPSGDPKTNNILLRRAMEMINIIPPGREKQKLLDRLGAGPQGPQGGQGEEGEPGASIMPTSDDSSQLAMGGGIAPGIGGLGQIPTLLASTSLSAPPLSAIEQGVKESAEVDKVLSRNEEDTQTSFFLPNYSKAPELDAEGNKTGEIEGWEPGIVPSIIGAAPGIIAENIGPAGLTALPAAYLGYDELKSRGKLPSWMGGGDPKDKPKANKPMGKKWIEEQLEGNKSKGTRAFKNKDDLFNYHAAKSGLKDSDGEPFKKDHKWTRDETKKLKSKMREKFLSRWETKIKNPGSLLSKPKGYEGKHRGSTKGRIIRGGVYSALLWDVSSGAYSYFTDLTPEQQKALQKDVAEQQRAESVFSHEENNRMIQEFLEKNR